ncbi:14402_t:CDS:2, partial [Acaulospora morrowiae]
TSDSPKTRWAKYSDIRDKNPKSECRKCHIPAAPRAILSIIEEESHSLGASDGEEIKTRNKQRSIKCSVASGRRTSSD